MRIRSKLTAALAIGMVAFAVLEYGSATGTTVVSTASSSSTVKAAAYRTSAPAGTAAKAKKKQTKAQKLEHALKVCKKDRSKSKRTACEKKARKLYGKKPAKKEEAPPEETKPVEETKPTETKAQELARAATVSTTPGGSSVTAGSKLFEANCSSCHGVAGDGTDEGPNLHEMPRAQSVTGIIEQLVEPLGGMPSFDGALTFEEKEAVADFVAVDLTHVAVESH